MSRKIKDSVVVITGASSGIGRATALSLAKKGAHLVLAARRTPALRMLAGDCAELGGSAIAAPTDVTDDESVQKLAHRAIENYGRIDVWINNAAVTLFSRFEETPPRAYRQVLETNLFGYIHGVRAAISQFREQGYGNLINISSSVARGGAPYISAYVTSKSGINGLTRCLRQELEDTDIDVCLVLPAAIDTPLYQQAANFTGRAVKPLEPVYKPEKVATAIRKLVKRPRKIVYVGHSSRLVGALNKFAPATYDKVMARQVEKNHFQQRTSPPNHGNLFEPTPRWAKLSGGWRAPNNKAASSIGKIAKAGLLLAIPTIAMLWWSNGQKNTRASPLRKLLPR